MDCPEVKRKLAAYAGGRLGEKEARDVAAHLDTCKGCAALVSRVAAEASPGSEAAAAAKTKPQSAPKPASSRVSRLSILILSAVALAAIYVAVALFKPLITAPAPPPPPPVQWWLDTSYAWIGDIKSALSAVKAVSWHEQFITQSMDGDFGKPDVVSSPKTAKCYAQGPNFCRELIENGEPRETQWIVSANGKLTKTVVRFDTATYEVTKLGSDSDAEDIVKRATAMAAVLDKANLLRGTNRFGGRDSVGFQIPLARLGEGPEYVYARIWLDVETKLPSMIEKETQLSTSQLTLIQDEFDWNAELPPNAFRPVIPGGFRLVTDNQAR